MARVWGGFRGVLFFLVYRVGHLRICMGLLAPAAVLDQWHLSRRIEGTWPCLCAEFPHQRDPHGISNDLGLCEEQPEHACYNGEGPKEQEISALLSGCY